MDRLRAAVGDVVKVYLPYCWGLVNSVTTCQVSATLFFYLSDKALSAGSEPSSQSIQKVRGVRGVGREFVSPQGEAERDGISHTLLC